MRLRTLVLAGTAAALLAAPSAAAGPCDGQKWVGSWAANPGHTYNNGFGFQTLRMMVEPHYAGDTVRVRLTNRLGTRRVTFSKVAIALSNRNGPELVPGTSRRVTFGGRQPVTMQPGAEVASDPVRLSVRPFDPVAVSMFTPGPTGPATEHFDAHNLSFWASGDHVDNPTGLPFTTPTVSWQFLLGLDVFTSAGTGVVTAFGDSLTDGFQNLDQQLATIGRNTRYPDYLARRLLARGSGVPLSVLNSGISGNRLLGDAPPGSAPGRGYGHSGLSRFERDVLDQPGASDVIVLIGTNDIGMGATAGPIVDGLRQLVAMTHARGLPIQMGTLLPAIGSPGHSDSKSVATWSEVNRRIRAGETGADRVIDFAAVVGDSPNNGSLRPEYDSGDHLHPNSAGYEAMANAIDLASFRGPDCSAPAVEQPRLSISVSPRRDRSAPYRFRVRGRLTNRTSCTSATQAAVRLMSGRRTVVLRRPRVSPTCRIVLTLAARAPGPYRVTARLTGTTTQSVPARAG